MFKKKLLPISLSLAAAMAISMPAMAVPTGVIDGPRNGDTISGLVNIWGWASDTVPISKVEFQVDTNAYKILGYGGTRGDVESTHPEFNEPGKSGFAGAFHSRYMTNGPHVIRVRITNVNGQVGTVETSVTVSNNPTALTNLYTTVDLSGATSRISGNRIFVDNVVINNATYQNVDLSFDDRSNAFVISKFEKDLNHDGYADDDLDRDGYHDDDLDRDGYHDDDLDRDGHHDDDLDMDGFHDDDQDRDGFHDDDLDRDGFHDSDSDRDGFYDDDLDQNGIRDGDENHGGNDNDGENDGGNDH